MFKKIYNFICKSISRVVFCKRSSVFCETYWEYFDEAIELMFIAGKIDKKQLESLKNIKENK